MLTQQRLNSLSVIVEGLAKNKYIKHKEELSSILEKCIFYYTRGGFDYKDSIEFYIKFLDMYKWTDEIIVSCHAIESITVSESMELCKFCFNKFRDELNTKTL